jgi:hypothetical protein
MFNETSIMEVNSTTYECWHEIGHAFVCLHLGGDVQCVELLEGHERGRARARCITNPSIRKLVACGGFATEFVLLRDGNVGNQDEKEIAQIIFKNATIDREMYHSLSPKDPISKTQDDEFMKCAVDKVAPIIRHYKPLMADAVKELEEFRSISGERIKQIINIT